MLPTTFGIARSSTEVGLRLNLTSLEGATVSTRTACSPTSASMASASSVDRSNGSILVKCPAASQKIALVLARSGEREETGKGTVCIGVFCVRGAKVRLQARDRWSRNRMRRSRTRPFSLLNLLHSFAYGFLVTGVLGPTANEADHGSFRHEFSYRTLPPPPAATAPATPRPSHGGNAGEPPPTDDRRGCGAPGASDAGMFAAQALLPGAMGVVSRARGVLPAFTVGGSEAAEGHGGGTVTGGDGEDGSATVARRR